MRVADTTPARCALPLLVAAAVLACGGDDASPPPLADTLAARPAPAVQPTPTFGDTTLTLRDSGAARPANDSGQPVPAATPTGARVTPDARTPTGAPARATPATVTLRDSAPAPRSPAPVTAQPTPSQTSSAANAPALPSGAPPSPDTPLRRPFHVGERLAYEVRFGPIAVGTATMHVVGVESIRGHSVYHTRFDVRGGNALYRVRDRYESWFDTRSLASLRYMQDINQGNYERSSVFEIYPEEQRFVEQGKDAAPSVSQPLDEGSFLYWLRTIPLEVGRTYTFDRYFRPDRNPVRIEVLRRERITVPAGTFDAIVVRPSIKTRGIFSEGGRAEVWFADDSTRRILQMKSRLSIGSLNLYLK